MRRWLAAAGVLAAALVAGAAVTVGFALSTGFDRAARSARLPDVIARFDAQRTATVDARVRGLPNLQARSYRYEILHVPLRTGAGRSTDRGLLDVLLGGRHGYAIVAGHDLTPRPGEVVVERGVAQALHLRVGDRLRVGRRLGWLRVTGIATSPDNVAYPLARTARVYVGRDEVQAAFGGERLDFPTNVALLWVNDRARTAITLAQARTVAFGLGNLRFITRTGVRLILDQAAGVVIALLSAFALVALAAAGTMLTAGAHAEVQRRLPGLGVRRALGFTRGGVVATHAREALLVAAPAAAAGLALGALAVAGPASALLEALNEQPPGGAIVGPLALAWVVVCAVVVGAASFPAWRAARRPIAPLLRGGDVSQRDPGRATAGGLASTGARFAVAARGRWAGSVATIGVCAGVVLLMLALASLLVALRDDPAVLGKRYQLSVDAPPSLVPSIEAVPGVQAATTRFQLDAADAFRLGQPLRLIAYQGDHTRFEAPALSEGRRIRRDGEVEVGAGLADALGLHPGSPLATLSPAGRELRLTVVGVVRALDNNGRIGWVTAPTLERAQPDLGGQVVIRLRPGADRARVDAGLRELAVTPAKVGGATTSNTAFLGILAGVLRAVALAVGLVCLYALVQGLAMTVRERRGALAVLRACGASRSDVAAVLGGAAAAVALPAALLAIALELVVLGPLVTRLAAGYAGLPLSPTVPQIAAVAGGLALLATAAAFAVARRLVREPVVRGLAVLAALILLAGCGSAADPPARPGASTLGRTLADPDGDGALQPEPGEPLRDRTALARASKPGAVLATFAQITDTHVRDEESPSRVPFLDRYGGPFSSTFRPQEALSPQVLAAAVRAVDAQHPQAVLVTGDITDNAQHNELELATRILDGGRADPNSGGPGYAGVQEASDPDPFYYRPAVDPPLHRRLLAAAERPFRSPGLNAPWYGVVGNHDVLLQGELPPDARTDRIATGDRLVTSLDPRARLPQTASTRQAVDALLGAARGGRSIRVPPDPDRRSATNAELVRALAHGRATRVPDRLDYSVDLGHALRFVVLDTVSRTGGGDAVTTPAQLAWLQQRLHTPRAVVVATHQTPPPALLAVLDRAPNVIAAIHGDTHRNRLTPHAHYWIVGTSSLADHPMQSRMFRLRRDAGGGLVLETWMVDQDGRGLAGTARELAFLDAQGGRPTGKAGSRADRNARLFVPYAAAG